MVDRAQAFRASDCVAWANLAFKGFERQYLNCRMSWLGVISSVDTVGHLRIPGCNGPSKRVKNLRDGDDGRGRFSVVYHKQ